MTEYYITCSNSHINIDYKGIGFRMFDTAGIWIPEHTKAYQLKRLINRLLDSNNKDRWIPIFIYK